MISDHSKTRPAVVSGVQATEATNTATETANRQVNIISEGGRRRESNLELFRIISMLVIVAHHYVVNSGLTDVIFTHTIFGKRDYFLLMFGCGGKTAINCFVLITGYFMCESRITLRKWLRLLGEVVFYGAVIYGAFVLTGYETFSLSGVMTAIFPFTEVTRNFTACYLLFYGLIPFLNRMLHAISEREHLMLVGLCLLIYTVLPSFLHVNVEMNYVTWFCVIYIIAAFLRMHPRDWFDHTRLWAGLTILSVLLSLGSIVWQTRGQEQSNLGAAYYYITDSNKILAVVTAVCAFMLFRNLRIPYSRFINTVAASTFGVLMIHANSNTMRQWLWRDVCRNVEVYDRWYMPLHAVGCVVAVYVSCTLIDLMRRWVATHCHGNRIHVKQ